jgi:hypothetical protein
MLPLIDDLNAFITKDIIQRLIARLERFSDFSLSASDIWQLEVMQAADAHYVAVQEEIAKWVNRSEAEVKAIFEDAGVKSWDSDRKMYEAANGKQLPPVFNNPRMMQIMEDTYRRTNGTIKNFTRTTATASQQVLINQLDNVHLKVMTGAQSYSQATIEAVEQLAKTQTIVHYPTGHKDTIETAVLRAVRTGTAQASGNMALQGMQDNDWDVILVSGHLGARYGDGGENAGNHFWWQAKLYSRTGKTPGLPLFDVCGYGTGEGLCGWNCRHSFGPGNVGHNPYKEFDKEENKKLYDLNQRQRALERRIRADKLKLIGLSTGIDSTTDEAIKSGLQDKYDKTAVLLDRHCKQYDDFCKDNNLKRLGDRINTAKWARSEAAKARTAARKADNK